ncbi:magnesium chelatase ATPase subunit I [Legionella taurinensis]|uniref:Mg-protoporphyrin IX chelatase n=2 Tax=Legionella taurinensis TaxID=70611 RepID=A0AB38N406_9GAMM|nr:magnesium chelatase ATPase subunit I [Legionella taurinensis]PUT41073.1 magnesium chelatase ATPase subunit I [Legionella taurinensis]PUT43448.1 magnesium chelatase ATPase subunit I [Legionella taurinensis]PUT46465.1 magnesium chelatase ATPase subunit I [Legionella taurinensis]TID32075.1 magnesium chelatase ATPase subunit I [Legionella taurinensis]
MMKSKTKLKVLIMETIQSPNRVYPFAGIVGQHGLKTALILNVIDPSIGGVLIMGHRGTGKSTIVRSLHALLPAQKAVKTCTYGCDPENISVHCPECQTLLGEKMKPAFIKRGVPIVDLPLGATEDRVVGSLNIETALTQGKQTFSPGLIAKANRGILYIDEVNLLEDHLVDLLLDVAASGVNVVEREGISIRHPAKFILIGSGNPEEGDLRPQLLDRFGLSAHIETLTSVEDRMNVVQKRRLFDQDPAAFNLALEKEQQKLQNRIKKAQKKLPHIVLPEAVIYKIAEICSKLNVDGHRGELTLCRACAALAAFEQKQEVSLNHLAVLAPLALSHRLRKDPLETIDDVTKIDNVVHETLGLPHEKH